MEVTEMWGNVLFIVDGLGISLVSLGESLGDCGRCPDVFGFGQESDCPNPIAFLELFLGGVFG